MTINNSLKLPVVGCSDCAPGGAAGTEKEGSCQASTKSFQIQKGNALLNGRIQ